MLEKFVGYLKIGQRWRMGCYNSPVYEVVDIREQKIGAENAVTVKTVYDGHFLRIGEMWTFSWNSAGWEYLKNQDKVNG